MGGEIWLEAEAERGSIFAFVLPRVDDAPPL